MSKKIPYHDLLKKAMAEYDTSKTVDLKGPMLDAIISYSGDGELPTHKDAASILERFYFNEKKREDLVSIHEAEDNEIPEEPEDNIDKAKDEIEDEVVDEKSEVEDLDKEEPEQTQAGVGDADEEVPDRKDMTNEQEEKADEEEEKEEEKEEEEEDLEEQVLEKLISEMEEDEDIEGEDSR